MAPNFWSRSNRILKSKVQPGPNQVGTRSCGAHEHPYSTPTILQRQPSHSVGQWGGYCNFSRLKRWMVIIEKKIFTWLGSSNQHDSCSLLIQYITLASTCISYICYIVTSHVSLEICIVGPTCDFWISPANHDSWLLNHHWVWIQLVLMT